MWRSGKCCPPPPSACSAESVTKSTVWSLPLHARSSISAAPSPCENSVLGWGNEGDLPLEPFRLLRCNIEREEGTRPDCSLSFWSSRLSRSR